MRTRSWSASLAFVLSAPLVIGCTEDLPEIPAIERDVARTEIDEAGRVQFSAPQIAPHRTSADGRVGVQVQGGGPHVNFYLFVPEKLTKPVLEEDPGAKILSQPHAYSLPFPPEGFAYPDNGINYARNPDRITGHHALCDPTTEFSRAGEQTNPYPCASDPTRDCYDLTLVNNTAHIDGAQMWGTPVHVEVANPKTPDAAIVFVEMGDLVEGAFLPGSPEWTEPMVTRDGRLLTGRIGIVPARIWTNPETGENRADLYDIMYSQLPDDAEPCDVTGWQDFHPISHAPYDPRMVGRYGIAAYPFRDAEGNLIEDGRDIGGSYPWVDETGANLFMTAVPERLADQPVGAFPDRCVVEGCREDPAFVEPFSHDIGFAMAGLWTHGKMVMLDGLINHIDWQVPIDPNGHRWITLYRTQEDPAEAVEVRVGSGRATGHQVPSGWSGNPNILHSVENLLNQQANLHPLTPRDVVWIMSTGVSTDEVAFDDFLNPDGFIVSNMQPSITREVVFLGTEDIAGTLAFLRYHNGKHWFPGPREYSLDVHIQNAATALPERWAIPSHGLVRARTGRIEPVAIGGIRGKGFWLDGANAIEYEIPVQPQNIRDYDWYVGIFVDPRSGDGSLELLRFPDGSAVWIRGREQVEYRAGGATLRAIDLPEEASDSGWIHLGWNLRDANRDIEFFHDGFPLDRFHSSTPLFELQPGMLHVGDSVDPTGGFRGWVDEFKVFAQSVNPEVACNHAYGTLVGIVANEDWMGVAARYPVEHHMALTDLLTAAGKPTADRYACYHDHTGDAAAHLRNRPVGTQSLREFVNFPEGPLRVGEPRPDSSDNDFCLSCHHSAGQMGLGTAALVRLPEIPAEQDPRRQPLQPLRRVFGNVPSGWIAPGPGPGSPGDAQQAPPQGLLIDPWVLAAADTDADGVPDSQDNCIGFFNPILGTLGEPNRQPFQTTTGGQLDDDADGFGNRCDAKFGNDGSVVDGADMTEIQSSFHKRRENSDCGSTEDQHCSLFDLDNQGLLIGGPDLVRALALFNRPPGPRCEACPLDCDGPGCPGP